MNLQIENNQLTTLKLINLQIKNNQPTNQMQLTCKLKIINLKTINL